MSLPNLNLNLSKIMQICDRYLQIYCKLKKTFEKQSANKQNYDNSHRLEI